MSQTAEVTLLPERRHLVHIVDTATVRLNQGFCKGVFRTFFKLKKYYITDCLKSQALFWYLAVYFVDNPW
jgi:hypothetical protein